MKTYRDDELSYSWRKPRSTIVRDVSFVLNAIVWAVAIYAILYV